MPKEFYAPQGLFSESDLRSLSCDYLGDRIYSPGFSFCYQVVSGPLCRIYWNNGKAEPHSFESAWQEVEGRWQRAGPNFLSYLVAGGNFVTVRWKPSLPEYWRAAA